MRSSTLLGLTLAMVPMLLLSSCTWFQAPKADIRVTPLHVGIENLEKMDWEKCTVTLNASAGDALAYRYKVGNIPAGSEQMVFLSQFAQKDGKRFLPILTQVRDVTLQCRNPGQALVHTVTDK